MTIINRFVLTFLLNAAWQITVVAAVAWCCSRLIRNAPARFVHRLWVGALVFALLVPFWSTVKTEQARNPGTFRVKQYGSAAQAHPSIFLSLRGPQAVSLAPSWMAALTGIYLILLSWRALGMLRTWMATKRLSTSAQTVEPSPHVMAIAERCRAVLGITPVSLLSSSIWSGSPLTLGFFRPRIVLPAAVWRLASEDEWVSILSHEMAHIRRRDLVKNLVYEFLRWPVFFHPAVAVLKRQIGRTRELACDEMATERLVGRSSYARALVNLAAMASGFRGTSPPNYSLSVSDPSILEERVMKLLYQHRLCPRPQRLLVLAFSVLLVSSLAIGAFAMVVTERPARPGTTAGNASGSPAQGEKIFTLADNITPPRPVSAPEPDYPQAEKQARKSGSVALDIVVGADGKVQDLQVQSSSAKDFEDASLDAVRKWTFDPGQKEGRPVPVKVTINIEFKLGTDKQKDDAQDH